MGGHLISQSFPTRLLQSWTSSGSAGSFVQVAIPAGLVFVLLGIRLSYFCTPIIGVCTPPMSNGKCLFSIGNHDEMACCADYLFYLSVYKAMLFFSSVLSIARSSQFWAPLFPSPCFQSRCNSAQYNSRAISLPSAAPVCVLTALFWTKEWRTLFLCSFLPHEQRSSTKRSEGACFEKPSASCFCCILARKATNTCLMLRDQSTKTKKAQAISKEIDSSRLLCARLKRKK